MTCMINLDVTPGIPGVPGPRGWTPVFAVVDDGDRRVLQVVDWTGSGGTKPTTGYYVGNGGLVPSKATAVNIRGPVDDDAVVAALAAQAAAEAAQAAAEDAAAAMPAIPAIVANSMLVDNEAGNARETKTFAEVNEKLGVFETKADASATTIDATINSLRLGGSALLGDGLGWLYVDTDNGATDTFTSNGGTRTWYRVADVGVARLAAGVSSLINGALQKSGGTMSGVLTWDNGTDPTIPTMTAAGAFDLNIGGTSHFKIWPDLDGDGDYDADAWSLDNMYIVASGDIHLRPNYPLDASADQGRFVFKAENAINYIQSGRNFSGTTRNDLAFTRYGSSYMWGVFDDSLGGWLGLGFSLGEEPSARLHVKDAGATIGVLQSTASQVARLGFAGVATTSLTSVAVGANGDDLELRASGAAQVRVNSVGMYPYADNARTLGSASFRWSTVYAGTGTINTSDATTKQWLGAVPEAVKNAMKRIVDGIGHYQFLDAIAIKGDGARKHLGVTAQDVIAAFEAEGLDPWEWAPICKDPVFTTVVKTRTVTREVLKMVERTRTIQKKRVESILVDKEKIEIRDGVPVLVKYQEPEPRPIVDRIALRDEQGATVFRVNDNGLEEPIIIAVPQVYDVEEIYTEEVIETEEYEQEYEEQVDTGEYLLGLRSDELLWGIVSAISLSK